MIGAIIDQVLRTSNEPLNLTDVFETINQLKKAREESKVRVMVPTITGYINRAFIITQPIIGWADERPQDKRGWHMVPEAVSQQHARWLEQHPKELARRRLEAKEKPATPAAGHTTHASEAST